MDNIKDRKISNIKVIHVSMTHELLIAKEIKSEKWFFLKHQDKNHPHEKKL